MQDSHIEMLENFKEMLTREGEDNLIRAHKIDRLIGRIHTIRANLWLTGILQDDEAYYHTVSRLYQLYLDASLVGVYLPSTIADLSILIDWLKDRQQALR